MRFLVAILLIALPQIGPTFADGIAAPPVRPVGIVTDPCAEQYATQALPGDVSAALTQLRTDWAQLCRYEREDLTIASSPAAARKVVFIGDSITANWLNHMPDAFQKTGILNRGISGQTTQQLLLRFRQDVISLRPEVVHILAGTNDIAGNGGPTTLDRITANLASMVELAQAHDITVVLGSVLPARNFPWRKEIEPSKDIVALNVWIKGYAAEHGLSYVDYYDAMTDGDGGLRTELSGDGVHPNDRGYAVMWPLARHAIDTLLKREHRPAK